MSTSPTESVVKELLVHRQPTTPTSSNPNRVSAARVLTSIENLAILEEKEKKKKHLAEEKEQHKKEREGKKEAERRGKEKEGRRES